MHKTPSDQGLDVKQPKGQSMKAEIQMLNEKGRPLPPKERKLMPRYHGQLRIHEMRSGELGRITPVAQLLSPTDSTEAHVLPALHDATVLFFKDGQMRIRGFELVDGAQFGQTWDVRVS